MRTIPAVAVLHGNDAAAKVQTLFQVQPQFLRASFATIREDYGSFAEFARHGLGLSADDVAQLRRDYLEPAP